MRSRLGLPLVALLLTATPARTQTTPGMPEIGVAASVVPRIEGTPPGRTLRSLQVGIDVLRNERIATGPAGRAQMLFRDGSALTVGPDSEVVLDEYVYDPESGTGREFSGSIAGGGVSGGLAGSFFQGGGDPVAEVGGQFAVSGSGYNAVGTIAGRR